MLTSAFRIASCALFLACLIGGRPCLAATVDTGLLGEYALLEDGSDLSSAHRDIVAARPVGFAATGPIAGAELTRAGAILSFTGYKPYVGNAPGPAYANAFQPGSTGYTVSGWIFVNAFRAPSVGGSKPVNVEQNTRGIAFAGFWVLRQTHQIFFAINSAPLSITGPVSPQDWGPSMGIISNGTIEARQWVHVAMTVDLASKSYALYINGRLDKSGTIDFLARPSGASNFVVSPTLADPFVAAEKTDPTATSILNGTVRDVTIHDRALSAQEIATLAAPDPAIIAQHAPLIYLHPEERFMPSSLEFFADNVHLECDGKRIDKAIIAPPASSIPVLQAADLPPWQDQTKPDSNDSRCALTSNLPMKGPYDILPFFAGQKPTAASAVPVYVFTYDVSSRTTFTAQYTTFYPYNQGKKGCPLFAPNDNCLAPQGRQEFDDHVGDWELTSIRFVGGEPVEVHVGAHGNDEPDMATTFVPTKAADGSITWQRKPDDTDTATNSELAEWLINVLRFFKPDAPHENLGLLWQGGHPIVYSAVGSHGIWATIGRHVYQVVMGDELTDYTAKGTPWETWRSLVIPGLDPRYQVMLFDFKGDWGNPHAGKSVCDFITDTVAGPGGSTILGGIAGLGFNGNPCDLLQAVAGAYSDKLGSQVESVNHLYQLNGGPHLNRERDRDYLKVKIYNNTDP